MCESKRECLAEEMAVDNDGAEAVCEGCGDPCNQNKAYPLCEYCRREADGD